MAWEEGGDIFLASINREVDQTVVPVEEGPSDSFHPVLGKSREKLWIFYLNDKDGFYRVYGKSFDGERPSDSILISEKGPSDAITPAAAWNASGTITIAWSDWKANFRYLKYRTLEERFLSEIQSIQVKRSDIEYTNAWCPSIVCGDNGKVWGAWNQHYPLTLGVYAGDLVHEAKGVSDQNGGYTSIVIDTTHKPWVFWETSMWNANTGESQKIQASYYDATRDRWALPFTVSLEEQTYVNQTPKGTVGQDGTIYVTWSGRRNVTEPWRIYFSYYMRNTWAKPRAVSAEDEYARAPAICAGGKGDIWITWHSGIGSEMKIKATRIQMP